MYVLCMHMCMYVAMYVHVYVCKQEVAMCVTVVFLVVVKGKNIPGMKSNGM